MNTFKHFISTEIFLIIWNPSIEIIFGLFWFYTTIFLFMSRKAPMSFKFWLLLTSVYYCIFATFQEAILKSANFRWITFKNHQSFLYMCFRTWEEVIITQSRIEKYCVHLCLQKTWDIFNSMRDIYFIFLSRIESKAVRKMKLIINIYVSTCVSHNVNLQSQCFFLFNVNNIILFELSCWATLQTS